MTFAPSSYINAVEREEVLANAAGKKGDAKRSELRLYPELQLHDFNCKLARVLPRLIDFLVSDELRNHPVWGSVIPYNIPTYGIGQSPGHCIRPDVLLTESGPKICELDFVPSGRGFLLAGLDADKQYEVGQTFVDWYTKMGVEKVYYATASTTQCLEETQKFAFALRMMFDFDIGAGNIETAPKKYLDGALIDRLSYRSEMSIPEERKSLPGHLVATAEPYLDSKAIFAMIHDKQLTEKLKSALGSDGLVFLREVIPETILVQSLKSEAHYKSIADECERWVIKATEVETDFSWGCRGTIPGASYNSAKFLKALHGEYPGKKNAGKTPILQRWTESKDFWTIWDGIISGQYARTELVLAGKQVSEKTNEFHTRKVGGRIGFYFLVVRKTGECLVTPYGDLVLRQDRLIHGASDAICLPVKAC